MTVPCVPESDRRNGSGPSHTQPHPTVAQLEPLQLWNPVRMPCRPIITGGSMSIL